MEVLAIVTLKAEVFLCRVHRTKSMSDLVERLARTFYEAGAEYWAQHNQTLPKWKDVYPETKDALFVQMRAVRTIVLEEAAKVAEGLYQQGQIGGDIAAAIRKLGEE